MVDAQAPETTQKHLREFGLLVGSILLLVSSYWWFYRDIYETARYIMFPIGALLFLIGLVVPSVLKPAYKVWMTIAHVLAWVNTRILISLIFFLVITPIGFVMRLIKGDLLGEKFHSDSDTYWTETEAPESIKEHCERQF